jgi:hypothetical protein
VKVTMVIVVDSDGHMTVEVTGAVAGKQGQLEILKAARELVEQQH